MAEADRENGVPENGVILRSDWREIRGDHPEKSLWRFKLFELDAQAPRAVATPQHFSLHPTRDV